MLTDAGAGPARWALTAWLLGWAVFGFPWLDSSHAARLDRIDVVPIDFRVVDTVLNCAYYLALGIVAAQLRWSTARIGGAALVLSLTTELSQVFSETRSPTSVDVIANVTGALIGFALARRRYTTRTG